MANISVFLDRQVERVSAAGNWISCMALIVVALGVTVNAFSRFLFKQPMMFVDEYAQYLLVAIFYFGVGYTLRAGKHVSVRMLVDRLHGASRAVVQLLVSSASLVIIGMLTWYSWLSFMSTYRAGMVSLTPLETPLSIPFAFVSIGMTIFFLEAAMIVIKTLGSLLAGRFEEVGHEDPGIGMMD